MPPNDAAKVPTKSSSTIDRGSLNDAKKRAATTGIPQPVRNRAGGVLYYVDFSGAVVPDAIAKDAIDRAKQKTQAAQDKANHIGHDLTGKVVPLHDNGAPLSPAEQVQLTAQQQQVAQANQQLGYVWVDGKAMKVTTVNKDGSYDVTIGASKSQPMSNFMGTTAFGALDSGTASALDPSTRFTMAYGQGDIFTGKTSAIPMGGPNYGGGNNTASAANPASAGEYSSTSNQVSNTTNMMTVGQGLTWLVNLSLQDPDSYKAMVDHLHDAGYLSDAQYAAGGGQYNSMIGQAFGQAATDTAVINAQPSGMHMSLYDYLAQRAAANKANQANSYKPVQRDYADPAALEGAARSLAQSDLGRDLTPDEVSQLVGHFHGLQDTMYDQVDAAGRQGQNARVTSPNVSGQVDTFIHDGANAQEAANWRVAQYGAAMNGLFGVGHR